MSVAFFTVGVSSIAYKVFPSSNVVEPEKLLVRCRILQSDGNLFGDVWRKNDVTAATTTRNSTSESPSTPAGQRPSATRSEWTVAFSENSPALNLTRDLLEGFCNGFLQIEVLTQSNDGDDSLVPFASALLSLAPFVAASRNVGVAHTCPLTKASGVMFTDLTLDVTMGLSRPLSKFCKSVKYLSLQQVMIQNLPESWSSAGGQFEVGLNVPLQANEADPENGSALHVALPRTESVDGTLTWSNNMGAKAVYVGSTDDDHVPLRFVCLDKQQVKLLRSAVEGGAALQVQLDRLVPDKKKVLNPDPASASAAALSLNGSGPSSQDSLLDDGATSIAAAVPLQPKNGNADDHPVKAAQSAVFVALKLSSPLSTAKNTRITGTLSVTDIVGNQSAEEKDDGQRKQQKFSSVQESESVLRKYLSDIVTLVMAEHATLFSSDTSSPLPTNEEQKQQVRAGLKANGFGGLASENLKYAVVGLLRERFRADKLKLDNARQSSTALIDLCSYLQKEVEATINRIAATSTSRASTRGSIQADPLLILAYDAEADGDFVRALRFQQQNVAAVSNSNGPAHVQAAAWSELGRCHVRAGNVTEGTIALQQALNRDPSCASAAATFGAVLLQRQLQASKKAASSSHLARALEVLIPAMACPPEEPESGQGPNVADHVYNLAMSLINQDDDAQADSSPTSAEIADFNSGIGFMLKLNLTTLGQACLDAVKPTLERLPSHAPGADEQTFAFYSLEMVALFQGGDDDGVLALSDEALHGPTPSGAETEAEETQEEGGKPETADVLVVDASKEEQPKPEVVQQKTCDDARFWRVRAQSQARTGDFEAALASYEKSLSCVDEVFSWDSGTAPSRMRLLLDVGDLCADENSGLGGQARAQEFYRKAATLGACPGAWFRLGKNCVELGQFIEAEDAFAKVTAMDNTHALVWAELAKLSLLADPVRLGDARQYVQQAFEYQIASRDALLELADAFLAAADKEQDPGVAANAREVADRCLRHSLALGEDSAIRARLLELLTDENEKEACRLFLSPRKGPVIA